MAVPQALSAEDATWLDACRDAARAHFEAHVPIGKRSKMGLGWHFVFSTQEKSKEDWETLMIQIRENPTVMMWAMLATTFPDRTEYKAELKGAGRDAINITIMFWADWGDADFEAPPHPEVARREQRRQQLAAKLEAECHKKGWKLCHCGINAHKIKSDEQKREEQELYQRLKREVGF